MISPAHAICLALYRNYRAIAGLFLLIGASLVIGLNLLGDSPDRQAYEWQFDAVRNRYLSEVFSEIDPLYFLIIKAASLSSVSFDTVTFVFAFCSLGLLHIAVASQKGINLPIFYILYASCILWLHNYTQIRIALAISLILFAILRGGRLAIPAFFAAISVHAAAAVPVVAWIGASLASRLPPKGLMALGLGAAAIIIQVATGFDGILSGLLGLAPNIAAKALLYVDLRDLEIFSEQNIFAFMPLLQLGIASYITGRTRKVDTFAILGFLGPICFYVFSFLPILAIRTYEMFIPFFLVYLARYVTRSRLLLAGSAIYVAAGVRQIFFISPPIVPLLQ